MSSQQAIANILQSPKPVFSVEFYPPKTEAGARQILKTANQLKAYAPDFVSITYGAGGSTRERTLEYGELLQDIFEFEVMPHLTCVGHSKDELTQILGRFDQAGFHNIMTLRGDPPQGEIAFKPHPNGLSYASELVAFIKERFPQFCLGVGGYPEKHPEAPSMTADLKHLQHKVAQGADFITTQLFFDNASYFKFVEACRAHDIGVPILPGILIALSFEQVEKFCRFCNSAVPGDLAKALIAHQDDEAAALAVGIDWAYQQISELLKQGAPGFHLYILNRADSAIELVKRLHDNARLNF